LKSNSDSAKEQAEGLVIAIRPFKDLILEAAEDKGLDHDEYGELFWALLKASLAGTKGAENFDLIASSDEAWSDMIVLLLLSTEAEPVVRFPLWGRRWAVSAYLFLAALLFSSAVSLPLSGRTKIFLALSASSCFALSPVWCIKGWDIGGIVIEHPALAESKRRKERSKLDDEVSIASASSRVRRENETLKRQLEQLQKPGSCCVRCSSGTGGYGTAWRPSAPHCH
jgi:hypothetical protein